LKIFASIADFCRSYGARAIPSGAS
jgi:hypothetical protein